jgi:hypothetical protein
MNAVRLKALCRFYEKMNSGSKIIGWEVHAQTVARLYDYAISQFFPTKYIHGFLEKQGCDINWIKTG